MPGAIVARAPYDAPDGPTELLEVCPDATRDGVCRHDADTPHVVYEVPVTKVDANDLLAPLTDEDRAAFEAEVLGVVGLQSRLFKRRALAEAAALSPEVKVEDPLALRPGVRLVKG